VVAEFRATLLAIGRCADRAVPSLGVELNQKMTGLHNALVQPVTSELLSKTNEQARNELSEWADHALALHKESERELREIITVLSTAADSVSERDEKYAREIGAITGRLGALAKENDLALVRRSIVESTHALNAWVARTANENRASVNHLTDQVKEYRTRLEEAERLSHTDPLTNLANRRAFEKHLETRVASQRHFCLIMIDLNDFKEVNDRYGHLAGDDLLKQFAVELRSQFTPAEMVGRWGGDEFIVVTEGPLAEAQAMAVRVRTWALGEYKIRHGERRVKTLLKASIGVAAWDGKESGLALLARVDQEVYQAKGCGEPAPG
jgi:diguanylate cyclase (GGDEF)-like protein